MLDYLGNEINLGDTVLFNAKATHGYYSSFTEDVVVGLRLKRNHVILEKSGKGKESNCCVNLTALGLRERVKVDG